MAGNTTGGVDAGFLLPVLGKHSGTLLCTTIEHITSIPATTFGWAHPGSLPVLLRPIKPASKHLATPTFPEQTSNLDTLWSPLGYVIHQRLFSFYPSCSRNLTFFFIRSNQKALIRASPSKNYFHCFAQGFKSCFKTALTTEAPISAGFSSVDDGARLRDICHTRHQVTLPFPKVARNTTAFLNVLSPALPFLRSWEKRMTHRTLALC